jgi:hypothetical protein
VSPRRKVSRSYTDEFIATDDERGEMTPCGDNTFCCDGELKTGHCNCSTKNGTISVDPGRVQTVIGLSATATTTSLFVSGATSTGTSTSKTKSTGTSSSTSTNTAIPKKKATDTIAFKAGLGAGLGVVVLALVGGLVFYFCFRHKRGSRSPPMGEYDGPSAYLTPAERPYGGRIPATGLSPPMATGRTTSPTANPFDSNLPSRSTTPSNMIGRGRDG